MRTITYSLLLLSVLTIQACSSDFLDKVPQGELIAEQLETPDGVEGALIGAYGLLNGNLNDTWGNYGSAPSQWLIGEVASDNVHKGSNSGDQPYMNQIELYQYTSANDNLSVLWTRCYEGISRCNNTLRLLASVQAGSGEKLGESRANEIAAEARMLRAHYYFFLRRVFINIPYVDENVTTDDAVTLPNDADIYPKIEEDFRFAVDNLPVSKPLDQIGRVDKTAAKAYLGKILLYLKRYDEALALFEDVIASRPAITTLAFADNFNVAKENGPESIFAVQNAINPNGTGDNANVGDMLGGFYGNAPVNCCGFNQPTFDLVSSFSVTAVGLPYLDNTYREHPIKSDFGLTGSAKTNYTVNKTIAIDPRLDYTVGRRGVPYRDWGNMGGDAWIRDPAYAGPFVGMKHTIEQSQFGSQAVKGALQITGLNVNLIRLSDVYLMAAECQVELGNLAKAMNLVNAIRERAGSTPAKTIGNEPAAAYKVGKYTSFPNADYARSAVRFERRLELSMEGHRFYDLVRWGIAKEVLESYSRFEGGLLPAFKNLTFDVKDTYFPIPQEQIDRSQGALKQNEGY